MEDGQIYQRISQGSSLCVRPSGGQGARAPLPFSHSPERQGHGPHNVPHLCHSEFLQPWSFLVPPGSPFEQSSYLHMPAPSLGEIPPWRNAGLLRCCSLVPGTPHRTQCASPHVCSLRSLGVGVVLWTLYSTSHPHIPWLQSSSEAHRERVSRTEGSCKPEDAWEGRCSYKEKTWPLGGIQGADHLQLDSRPEAARSAPPASGPASTSSPGRNPGLQAFPLQVAEVVPHPHPRHRAGTPPLRGPTPARNGGPLIEPS